ncbi:MAG: phospholipid/cholesterol/gamma-HCH transport system substrate-binding protein [Pseudonocardiales bacterium]|jgi:phospholipid/cholesterol/gamma-HCH transport system substrate-binding protein|nr:phospholipid/cholesterol/gamma-HCH transport system substrate-binding protein [Pseudonocardiales bacterium]MDT4920595.1 phospholipid/cholesterol/gamma-HCH transport system substrate-binding protein [Pseudonocardiales bacterium]
MKPIRERNQVSVAIWGTLLAAAVVLLAMNLGSLPFIHPTTTYYADFANADGLKSGDDVRVEGISVGSVDSVEVQGDHVHVRFDLTADIELGGQSRATIEVATVLGNLFMQVESEGPGTLAGGATIPVERTVVPYSLLGALNAFGEFSEQTNLPTLRTSLRTLASTIAGVAPADARAALRGLAEVSGTLASKQQQVSDVLSAANSIVHTLDRNSGALVGLLLQGQEFLHLVVQRQAVVSSLLKDTARLGTQLRVLMQRNGAQLDTFFDSLDTVSRLLAREKGQLQRAVVYLGQFGVNITNVTGAGPWLDLLTPSVVVPDNQIKNCGTDPAAQKKPCGR